MAQRIGTTGGRTIAIGDIHGATFALERLLVELAPQPADRLVFLGDYIDRGPDSHGVVERLLQLEEERPDTVFLRGNHEQWLLSWLFGEDDTFLYLGGRQTWQSYARAAGVPFEESDDPADFARLLPDDHLAFFDRTRLFYETDDAVFVHAGLDPRVEDLSGQSTFALLMGHRDFFKAPDYGRAIVVGHTATQIFRRDEPVFLPNGIVMCDTGGGYDGPLSAVEPVTGRVWQVPRVAPGGPERSTPGSCQSSGVA